MLVSSIVPLLIGIILGNLDPRMRQCLSAGGEVTIMVLGFALGANMSLQQVAQGGVPGIVLGLITVVLAATPWQLPWHWPQWTSLWKGSQQSHSPRWQQLSL